MKTNNKKGLQREWKYDLIKIKEYFGKATKDNIAEQWGLNHSL